MITWARPNTRTTLCDHSFGFFHHFSTRESFWYCAFGPFTPGRWLGEGPFGEVMPASHFFSLPDYVFHDLRLSEERRQITEHAGPISMAILAFRKMEMELLFIFGRSKASQSKQSEGFPTFSRVLLPLSSKRRPRGSLTRLVNDQVAGVFATFKPALCFAGCHTGRTPYVPVPRSLDRQASVRTALPWCLATWNCESFKQGVLVCFSSFHFC